MEFLIETRKKIPELKYILLLLLSTRFVLTIIGLISRTLLERQYGKQYVWSKYLWLDIWGVWDSFWYMDIATHGYSLEGRNPLSENQSNYSFFPLYPMLMKILGMVLGGDKYYIAGIIVSNISLIIACIFLYKLVMLEGDKKTALNSVKYLFLFPTAFIFSGIFTESLYVALTILCFYFAKKDKFMFAGIAGFFLSLTRLLGVLCFTNFSYLYYFSETKQRPLCRPSYYSIFRLTSGMFNGFLELWIPISSINLHRLNYP